MSARPATGEAATIPSPPPPPLKLPPRSRWPVLNEDAQVLLMGFLTAYRGEAVRARAAAEVLLACGPELRQSQGMVEYWSRAVSVCDQLIGRVGTRQKWLAELAAAAKAAGEAP